ncbi:hypothetical protein [Kitasatospora atroaurantiaca]|uniref:hypothetical protein n=1 Tax=Kitasatospora atroaurantiaca TaxID=285545 RepID=UPI0011A08A72|nr:hypothetical protein [Kitasatospora atroaurantiaca]
MADLQADPATVHLVHAADHVNPGVTAEQSVKGSVRIDERGWVHVERAGGGRVSFPPHAVARVEWDKPGA